MQQQLHTIFEFRTVLYCCSAVTPHLLLDITVIVVCASARAQDFIATTLSTKRSACGTSSAPEIEDNFFVCIVESMPSRLQEGRSGRQQVAHTVYRCHRLPPVRRETIPPRAGVSHTTYTRK